MPKASVKAANITTGPDIETWQLASGIHVPTSFLRALNDAGTDLVDLRSTSGGALRVNVENNSALATEATVASLASQSTLAAILTELGEKVEPGDLSGLATSANQASQATAANQTTQITRATETRDRLPSSLTNGRLPISIEPGSVQLANTTITWSNSDTTAVAKEVVLTGMPSSLVPGRILLAFVRNPSSQASLICQPQIAWTDPADSTLKYADLSHPGGQSTFTILKSNVSPSSPDGQAYFIDGGLLTAGGKLRFTLDANLNSTGGFTASVQVHALCGI